MTAKNIFFAVVASEELCSYSRRVEPIVRFTRDAIGRFLVCIGAVAELSSDEMDECAFWCAMNGMQRTLKALLADGADPDAAVNGWTALRVVCEDGYVPKRPTTVALLIASGADPWKKNPDGRSVFDVANPLLKSVIEHAVQKAMTATFLPAE